MCDYIYIISTFWYWKIYHCHDIILYIPIFFLFKCMIFWQKERPISKVLRVGQESIFYLLAFLLAIIIATIPCNGSYTSWRESSRDRRRGVSYFRRTEKRIPVCPGRGGLVHVRMCIRARGPTRRGPHRRYGRTILPHITMQSRSMRHLAFDSFLPLVEPQTLNVKIYLFFTILYKLEVNFYKVWICAKLKIEIVKIVRSWNICVNQYVIVLW